MTTNPYLSGNYAYSITSDTTLYNNYSTGLNASAYDVSLNTVIYSLTVDNNVQISGGGGRGAGSIGGSTYAQGGSHAIINGGGTITNLYNYGILQGGGGGGGTTVTVAGEVIPGNNGNPGGTAGNGSGGSGGSNQKAGGGYGNYPPTSNNNDGQAGETVPVYIDGVVFGYVYYGGGGGGGGGGTGGSTSSSGSNPNGTGGYGGYSIVNQGNITNFYNSQGNIGNPVYIYCLYSYAIFNIKPLISNYYINITNSTTYGQLFYYGYSQTINFDIDPNSSISITTSTTLEYAIYDSGSNLTISNTSGTINKNNTTYYWVLNNSSGNYSLTIYPLNPIGYKTSYNGNYTNEDLINIFQPYTSGTQVETGYKTNNKDLSEIFQPYTGGTQADLTGYKTNNQDLSEIFQPL